MTVSYTGDVANGSSFGCFWKILLRWKGSVYKLIWRELIAYLCIYFGINLIYRFGMDEMQKKSFEKLKVYCRMQIESIPMSFVLGFYVTLIVKRWWDQYWILPLPDSLALYINAGLHGQDERSRLLRRTIMRYTMLSYIITLQRISFRVKKRFPTLDHLVDTGFMMESEKKIFDTLDAKTTVSKFWMPIVWATNLINRAKLEGRIHSDHMLQTIITEISDFRRRLGRVMVYDTVSVPLVYTQVVTLAVYTYFAAALVGKQWVNPLDHEARHQIYPGYEIDLYFPIFLSLQFIFYVGWLKVAETLINPFGEDDDDFELNWLIDRHFQVSYMVVDEMHEEHPELLKDTYWEQVVPTDLPYNIASENYRRNEPLGSTASMKIKEREAEYDNLTSVKRHSTVADDVYGDYAVVDSPGNIHRKSLMQRVQSFRSTSSSSSLFARTKSQNKNTGNFNNVNGMDKNRPFFWNRRSSKDRNSAKSGNNNNGEKFLSPRNINIALGNRPRVPTPDVSKETAPSSFVDKGFVGPRNNPIQLTVPTQNKPVHSNQVPNSYAGGSIILNNVTQQSPESHVQSYSKPFNNYNGKTMENVTNHVNNVQAPSNLPIRNVNGPLVDENLFSNFEVKRTSKSPLPFDVGDAQQSTLTTIEENDGSPHSTCSTARSVKMSTYPTTKSIFGTQPNPVSPPSQDTGRSPSVQNSGFERQDSSERNNGLSSGEMSVDSAEFESPYMTISEVKESQTVPRISIDSDYGSGIQPINSPKKENGNEVSKKKGEQRCFCPSVRDCTCPENNMGSVCNECQKDVESSLGCKCKQSNLFKEMSEKENSISDGRFAGVLGFGSSNVEKPLVVTEGTDSIREEGDSKPNGGELDSHGENNDKTAGSIGENKDTAEVCKDCEVFV